jgi:hypothetical protein
VYSSFLLRSPIDDHQMFNCYFALHFCSPHVQFLIYFIFHSISNRSRKRRTSYSQDEREYLLDGDDMDECNAALVLMSLSCSPNSPRQGNVLPILFYFILTPRCWITHREDDDDDDDDECKPKSIFLKWKKKNFFWHFFSFTVYFVFYLELYNNREKQNTKMKKRKE